MVVSAVGLAALGCQIHTGGPEPPASPIPVATSSAAELRDQWEQALQTAALTGTIILELTETQLTSLVAARFESSDDPLLHDTSTYLREGQIQIFGIAERGLIRANVLLVVAPSIDADGTLTFELVSADFGPLPASDGLRESLSALLTEAFTGTIGPLATGLRIDTVLIADGTMTIIGEVR